MSDHAVASAVGGRIAAFVPRSAVAPLGNYPHVVSTHAVAVGATFGALALVLVLIAAIVFRRTDLGAGIAFVVAAVLAMRSVYGTAAAPGSLLLALVLLGAGGALSGVVGRVSAGRTLAFSSAALLLLPGAVALAHAFPDATPSWIRWSAVVGTWCCAVLLGDFETVHGTASAPFALFVCSAIGVYYTVPDTELALVMMGCALPLAALSVPRPTARLGQAGSAAMAGIFVWVVVIGGRGRPGSVVAGIATLGILLVEPIVRRRHDKVAGSRATYRHWHQWLAAVGFVSLLQLGMGAYFAKVPGPEHDARYAAMWTIPVLLLVGALGAELLPTSLPHRASSKGKTRGARSGGGHRSRRTRASHSQRETP